MLPFYLYTTVCAGNSNYDFQGSQQCPLVLVKADRIEDGALGEVEGKEEKKDLFCGHLAEGSS
jgi:hypothetical protein